MTDAQDKDARHAAKMKNVQAAREKIMAEKTIEKGLLIVHTGNGKGKSTAALGMVFRHIGYDMPRGVVQFTRSPDGTRARRSCWRASPISSR